MFNVSGVARATNLKDVSPRLVVGSVYTSKKVGDEWVTTFIKAKFVGNGLTKFIELGIKEKDKFIIESGVLEVNKYTNKEGTQFEELVLTIFEVDKFIPKADETPQPKEEKKSRFKK